LRGQNLTVSENICRIFNVYELYRRSSSAIQRIVDSLTPTIDANFHNDCPGSSEISLEPFQQLRGFSRCVLSSDSSSLAYWNQNLRWIVLKPYILSQCHKRLISSIQRTELFPLLSAQCEGLQWSRLFDYTPHFNIAAILRIWLEHQVFSEPTTISGGGTI